jgi:predicted O-methyltransferase YrrM
MASRPTKLTDDLHDYLLACGFRDHPALAALRAETAKQRWAIMQIAPEQGAFMQLLVELTGAKRCLEVGTFTGYSALAVALALPPDGRVTALDVSEEWTAIARRHWAQAGVAEKIELLLGDAGDALDRLIAEGRSYDFAFIDADKEPYDRYYEACLKLVRPGGLIALDNMFQGGRVVAPASEEARAIDALNRKIQADRRVSMVLLPLADGLMLCRRRP